MKTKINYKQIFLEFFLFCLKYTILTCGIMGLLYFWNVDLKQVGFWNFIFGGAVLGFAFGIAGQIKYKGEEEE